MPARSVPSPTLPLRDWKRAFAIVDALKAELGRHPWFHGIRAFWDAHRDSIRIEVETRVAVEPRALLSPRLLAQGVGVRCVAPAQAVAAAALSL